MTKKAMKRQFAKIRTNEELLFFQNGKCFFCDTDLTTFTMTRDHFFPKSKGVNGSRYNFVAACKCCNGKKADRLPTVGEVLKFVRLLDYKKTLYTKVLHPKAFAETYFDDEFMAFLNLYVGFTRSFFTKYII